MTKAKYRRASRLCSLVGKKKKGLFVFAKSHSEGTHKNLTTRGAGVGTGTWGAKVGRLFHLIFFSFKKHENIEIVQKKP